MITAVTKQVKVSSLYVYMPLWEPYSFHGCDCRTIEITHQMHRKISQTKYLLVFICILSQEYIGSSSSPILLNVFFSHDHQRADACQSTGQNIIKLHAHLLQLCWSCMQTPTDPKQHAPGSYAMNKPFILKLLFNNSIQQQLRAIDGTIWNNNQLVRISPWLHPIVMFKWEQNPTFLEKRNTNVVIFFTR